MMDRIKCATCGAETYNDPGRTKLHCATCYDSAAAALEAEREKWNSLVVEIRDLARTDLPIGSYTEEDWALHRLRRIAGMANRAVEGA